MNESANNNQFNGMNTNNGTYNNQNFSVQDNNTSQNTNVTTNVYSDNGTNIINDSDKESLSRQVKEYCDSILGKRSQ